MKIVTDENIPFVEEAFSAFGDVYTFPGRDISSDKIRDADLLLVRTVTPVDEKLLRNSRVRFVGTATIGYDHVDIEYLKKRNIAFSYAAGCNANSVAEYVIAALFVLAERYNLKLQDMTLGVVGVGNVGSKVVEKAQDLGINVLVNDPPKARLLTGTKEIMNGQEKYDEMKFISLNRLVAQSDIVTLHVPLTFDGEDATYRMVNLGFFNKMKKDSFIINTSRGQVVDTHALLHALYHGDVKSAVIDVWEGEPDISTTLLDCIDIGTPHIAGYSRDGKVNATRLLYEAASNHCGSVTEWVPGELPAPRFPIIDVTKNRTDTQSMLGAILKKAYDIQRDDRALRKMVTLPARVRSRYFEKLRTEYPVRREFHSMTVRVYDYTNNIVPELKSLGFKVAIEQNKKKDKKESIS